MASQETLSPARTRKTRIYYGYIVVAASVITSLFLIGPFNSFSIFFKPLSSELGWSRTATSVAGSIGFIVMGLVGLIAGRVTDKYGPGLVLIASGLLTGLGNLLMSQVHNLWQLYLFWGIMVGAGMSASDIPIVTTIARWFIKRRGIMIGITKAGAGVGMMVLPLIASWLISIRGWREAYMTVGTLALVGIISMALLIKRDPSQIGELPYGQTKTEISDSGDSTVHQFSLKESLSTRQFWLFSSTWLSFMFCAQAVMMHIVNHVTDIGIPATVAATIVGVIGGFSILGRLGLAGLSDILGAKTAYILDFSFLAVALLWIQFAREPWMFYLFAAFYGTAHGASFTLLAPMLSSLFGIRSLGSILSMVLLFGTFGGVVGPILAGRIFDTMGDYKLAFWVCFGISAIGLTLLFILKPTHAK